jgi:hypothetical protein
VTVATVVRGQLNVGPTLCEVAWRFEKEKFKLEKWFTKFKNKNKVFFVFLVKSKNIFGMPKQMEPKLHYANNLTSIILQNRF